MEEAALGIDDHRTAAAGTFVHFARLAVGRQLRRVGALWAPQQELPS